MKKAVIYVRVSSKEQRDEGYSIPAQLKLLRQYARKNEFKVLAEYEESETAKQSGRTEFRKMLRLLGKDGSIDAILVEKTDRLYRNFYDVAKVEELGRTIHFVKDGQILSPDAKSSDRLQHNVKVVLARHYIDNLSEETKKGMREKAEQGLFPSYAPLGYVNNRETGRIDVDFSRAGVIRELFVLYAGGDHSIRDLVRIARERGLRSRKGRTLQKSFVARILTNPIYIGDFTWNGTYYEGKHEAILTRSLFERVQDQLIDRHTPRTKKKKFAFRGLIRCGNCGCLITAEVKKSRYIYYRCTHGRGDCAEKPIREERLAELLGEPLKRLKITPDRLEWILDALKASHEDEKAFHRREVRRLEDERDSTKVKIDRLYEDRLSGVITEEFWKEKYEEFSARKRSIEAGIEEHSNADSSYLESGARILELAKNAYSLYVKQDPFEQRKLLDLMVSNCTLQGGRVDVQLNEVFQILADGAEEEEALLAVNAPQIARDRIWLPGSNPLHKLLSVFADSRSSK
jgi:DNA invertase Pin-like site-specific DNA recombinase